MTEASELFVNFQELWRAGKNACLNMECYAEQAWLSLHIHLSQQPPPQPHLQRRQGPSRLRHRAGREAARERASRAAVKAATICESSPDASTVNAPAPDINTAEEAGNEITPAVPLTNKTVPVAEKAIHPVSPVQQVPPKLNVLARPWSIPSKAEHHVPDELCSDKDYKQQSSPSQPLSPPNQCEVCGKSFGSSKALNKHVIGNHEPKYL